MKLTLTLEGKKKEYYSRGQNAGASLRAFRLQEDMERRMAADPVVVYDEEHIEELTGFVVELFGGQFTEQEFLEGCTESFFVIIPALLQSAVQGTNAAIQEFPGPNGEAPPAAKKKR